MTMLMAAILLAAAQKTPPPPPPPNTLIEIDKLMESGQQKLQKGDYAAAMADFNRVLRLDAKNAKAFSHRGLCQAGLKQFDKALPDFAKAIEIDPRHTYAYVGRGDIQFARREYEEAIKEYSKAIEINPLHPTAPALRGLSWMAKGDYVQAHPDLERSLRLLSDAKDAPALSLRGAAKHWTHDLAGAETDLTRALDLAPRLELALFYRGRNRIFLGKPHDAQGDLRRAVDVEPRDGEAWLAFGDAYAFDFAYVEAIKTYRQASVADPTVDGAAHLRLWRAQMRGGQKDQANSELQQWYKEHKPPLPDGDLRQTTEFFLGITSPEVYLAGIDAGADRKTLERRCARDADAGLMRLLANDFAAAEVLFRKSVETDIQDLVPWVFASTQLQKK
jgi:tetratricopeptide (TPR) repeat protein